VIKALRLPVADVEQWEDFRRKALAPPSNVTARLRGGTLSAVEEIIGASFKYPHLLSQALVCIISLRRPSADPLLDSWFDPWIR
jgi:endoribonuclease Dicer